MRAFPLSHPLVALEDDAGVHGNDDAVVAEFAEEASVPRVDGLRYGTEVADVVVEGIAVDMVDGIASRDLAFEGKVLKAGEVYTTKIIWYTQVLHGCLKMFFVRTEIKLNLSVSGIDIVSLGV